MILNTLIRYQKLLAVWEHSISKKVPTLRNDQIMCNCISPNASICCRSLPACENIGKEEGEKADKKTVLGDKSLAISVCKLFLSRRSKVNMASVDSTKCMIKITP